MYPWTTHYGMGRVGWMAAGKAQDEILADYPELEPEDFRAVFEYAARLGRQVAL